jgi:hypothetical protein
MNGIFLTGKHEIMKYMKKAGGRQWNCADKRVPKLLRRAVNLGTRG